MHEALSSASSILFCNYVSDEAKQNKTKQSTTDGAVAANVHPNTGHEGAFAEAVATARSSATKWTPAQVPTSEIVCNITSNPSPADSSSMGQL